MNKDLENMTERELLAELVRQGRRTERADRIKTCVLAALLLALVILAAVYVPKIMAPIREISAGMEQIEAAVDEARRILSSFDDETVESFKETMESLGETSQQARVLMDKLKDSGLDKLQSAIEGLNDSLGSILKFFGR